MRAMLREPEIEKKEDLDNNIAPERECGGLIKPLTMADFIINSDAMGDTV